MKYAIYIVSAGFFSILTGCKDITSIQHQYVADRDGCIAKSKSDTGIYFDTYPNMASDKDKVNIINEVFCECMHDHGWKTARTLFDPFPECPKPPSEVKPDAKAK